MAAKVLENISGRMKTYTLSGAHLASHATHEHRYKPVRRVTVHQSKSGQLVPRFLTKTMPDSLRLAAGDSRKVDEAVVHCPEIKAAIARQELRVSDPVAEPAPAPAAAPGPKSTRPTT